MSQRVAADSRIEYFQNALDIVVYRVTLRVKGFSNRYRAVPLFMICRQFEAPRWRYFNSDYVAKKM
jgi:hypothetical protein